LHSDSFTIKTRKNELFLTTSVGISTPFDETHIKRIPKPYWTAALWDTGATHCSITASLAKELDLIPASKVRVEHAKGVSYENLYFLTLHVTKKYYVEIELTECQSVSNNFEIIIGMNVISHGDFALTSKNGIITFSFRLPSSTHIDFTKPTTG
jgi:hypothetical protein